MDLLTYSLTAESVLQLTLDRTNQVYWSSPAGQSESLLCRCRRSQAGSERFRWWRHADGTWQNRSKHALAALSH